MPTPNIRTLLASTSPQQDITVQGWVRTRRDSKACTFISLNDGSCLRELQVVADHTLPCADLYPKILTGASVRVTGDLVASPGAKQSYEVLAKNVELLGEADGTYPLQKKGHTPEFLRSISHLRPRTNLLSSVFRVRSRMAFAIHQFFQEQDFFYVHTPIITASDCEGAGEMFRVTTLPQGSNAKPDQDFFGKPAYLTVSGQLQGETFACALSRIYTFGPTFRAENSNTARHAAEFWMIEPEMAFFDLDADMTLAEQNVKYLIQKLFETCSEELEFFNKFIDKDLITRLQHTLEKPFQRISYTDAVEVLLKSGKQFEYPVAWGENLQSEHERFLAEEHFKSPVTVFNYPKTLKPFYMRQNDDGKTVAAMDVLVPGIGEIIGGSQREERLDLLEAAMAHHGLDPEGYRWYADLRRYGSVPHAGYGMGFERFLMFATGVSNIRDVIPFARTPGHADF
ncbi:asparaginyl-tRNA synthetase [Roseimicrobium gellanilyticum]|uniref:Asparagine--tRNA ligase n=1 Tax=Roseimicrobium gellanilyticum TaxID=748857 RepID=A0A366HRC4_9BACT|nr:asparagine--tRNA ligase [Roseimicrobium gellanilyticum]RBP46221.1 asparaginyl-tRNA synthetase [Roseimicrobium gellanilyticum]